MVIAAILSQASYASNSDVFDPYTAEGAGKIKSWEVIVAQVPTEHLLELYKFVESGRKSHSGMMTPNDMLKNWAEYKAAKAREITHKRNKEILPEAEQSKNLAGVFQNIYGAHGGMNAVFQAKKKLHKFCGAGDEFDFEYVPYPEKFIGGKVWSDADCKFIMVQPSRKICACENPPSYYIYKPSDQMMCLYCACEIAGIQINQQTKRGDKDGTKRAENTSGDITETLAGGY